MNNEADILKKSEKLRKFMGEDNSSPVDVFTLVLNIDKLSLVLHPLGENISGICVKSDNSNLIIINSDMSLGRQKFSLAHELYHLYFDKDTNKSISFKNFNNKDTIEKEANQFASYFLIPSLSLSTKIDEIYKESGRNSLAIDDIIELEQYFGVSHLAMLYRLKQENYINQEQLDYMNGGIINKAAKLGYDTSLYYPSSENKKRMVYGHYIKNTDKLLEKNLISFGKYEEYLLDANRDDIVYGLEDEEDITIDWTFIFRYRLYKCFPLGQWPKLTRNAISQ